MNEGMQCAVDEWSVGGCLGGAASQEGDLVLLEDPSRLGRKKRLRTLSRTVDVDEKRGCLATQCLVCSTNVILTRRPQVFGRLIPQIDPRDMFCVNVVGGQFVMRSFFSLEKRGWKNSTGFFFFFFSLRQLFAR